MECSQKWLDVFITNADPDQESDYDDQHVTAVQSVRVYEDSSTITASIVEEETDWVIPTFPEGVAIDPFKEIRVGDLVRIGIPNTHGFTDYLTVVEKVAVNELANGTGVDLPLHDTMFLADGTTARDVIEPTKTDKSTDRTVDGTGSTAHKLMQLYPLTALRLNHSVDCTSINQPVDENMSFPLVTTTGAETNAAGDRIATVKASLSNRHNVHAWGGYALYPMYHMKEWRADRGQLTAELDHGVKEIQQVKLVGYSLMNKRQVGPQHAHEMIQDDYLILRIKEVDGRVISNNRHANGAFAVLYAGAHGDNDKGGADVHKYDPDGLVVQNQMSSTNKIMRNLTVQLTDRTGQPAHFGRLHLWFKILASHG